MNSLIEIQARALLSNISWLNDTSFENLIFTWMKLVYIHKCKKRSDFLRLFEEFRQTKLNKYIYNHPDIITPVSDFIALGITTVQSKADLILVVNKMNAFKSFLEPFVGGYHKKVPVPLIWAVDAPDIINTYFEQHVQFDQQQRITVDITDLYTDFIQQSANNQEKPYTTAWNNCYANKSDLFATEISGLREERNELRSNTNLLMTQLHDLQSERNELRANTNLLMQQLHDLQSEVTYLHRDRQNQSQREYQAYLNGQYSCHGYDLRQTVEYM